MNIMTSKTNKKAYIDFLREKMAISHNSGFDIDKNEITETLYPHKDRTEYTDLSQVWHNTSDIPSLDKEIVGLMDNGAIRVISRSRIRVWSMMNDRKKIRIWDTYTCIYKIVKWAYVDDLLPKGGEE